mgnify:CR=1 FL=1
MLKSKFYRSYAQLTAKEQKQFAQYVVALHAEKKTVVQLLRYFQNADADIPPRAEIFRQVFGVQVPYNYRKISDALSDLYLLVEEFLIWKKLYQNKLIERDFILLEIFRERGMHQLFGQKLDRLAQRLERQEPRDMWSFLDRLRVHHQRNFHRHTTKADKQTNEVVDAMQALDHFFIASKLVYACELKSRAKIIQEKYPIPFLPQIRADIAKVKSPRPIHFELYLSVLKLLENPSTKSFTKLKTYFFTHAQQLYFEDQSAILAYLINYQAQAIKEGQEGAVVEAFALYQFGLDNHMFIENHYISHVRFHNIVNIACNLGKYDWAADFMTDWEAYLDAANKASAIVLGRARLAFARGEFESVLRTLQEVKFSDVFYAIRSRVLLLRTHYELHSETELILGLSKSFEVYIRRNRTIQKLTKLGLLNFIRALRILVDWKFEKLGSTQKLEQLHPVAYRDWVWAKLAEK